MSANSSPVTSAPWSPDDSARLYNLAAWSDGYFAVSDSGQLAVQTPGAAVVQLADIIRDLPEIGLQLPLLVRFSAILRDRVRALCDAFSAASADHDFAGQYTVVYPIKVNQQRSVIEQIVAAGDAPDARVGLEAGSKPELLAVLAMSRPGGTVICNGYKDAEYVRLALRGQQMGLQVTLVVEKLSELALILEQSRALGVTPRLGLRVRLASIASGNWQNTGGEKSKFGLTAAQLLQAVETLRAADMLHALGLLHVHLGSQIANVRDIARGLRETVRVYTELHRAGAPLDTLDVGGGLGVDYDGTRSRSDCSMNYSLHEYAATIVRAVADGCAASDVPQPNLISESGRALTAHHAVLITDVIDAEPDDATPDAPASDHPLLADLWRFADPSREQPATQAVPPLEALHAVAQCVEDAQTEFTHGTMTLQERAQAELLGRAAQRVLYQQLDPTIRAEAVAREALATSLAGKYFLNFSVFQSLPDVWGIDQVFPIVPIQRLDQEPRARVTVCDLTCDSDGRIDDYVQRSGVEPTLPVHVPNAGEQYCLAVCMVGAYQEILGDLHNLFGDTDTVNIEPDADAARGWRFTDAETGDTADELLAYVHHAPDTLLDTLTQRCRGAGLHDDAVEEMSRVLRGSTYFRSPHLRTE